MNILYLCTYYHRAMIFRDSMDALEKRGHLVVTFNAADKGEIIDTKYRSIMDNKVVHKECFYSFEKYFYPIQQIKFSNSVSKSINVQNYDIIHSHMLFSGGLAALLLSRQFRIPFVVTIRNTDVNSYMRLWIFRCLARIIAEKANGILFLSSAYEKSFFQKCYKNDDYRFFKEKTAVIPNGLERFWLDNINIKKSNPTSCVRLICVGKIDKNKNMVTVAEASKLLAIEGIQTHLTVIGQVLDERVKNELSSYDNIQLIPFMSKETLIDYYRRCDIFVMPSFHESFGRVYAEAMTQGLPVIYTRNEGFDGFFAEGKVGYSVDPHNPSDIANAVKKVLLHYSEISDNCVKNCAEFDWEKIAAKLEMFYLKSIGNWEN